jgi:hypothetical protein
MTNDITPRNNTAPITPRNNTAPATRSDSNPFTDFADNASQRTIVGKLLKFSKGDWLAGQDNDEVEEGSQFIANMGEMLQGWQRWEDNKPTDSVLGKVVDRFQVPLRSELPDQDRSLWDVDISGKERDPWAKTNLLLLKSSENGELYTFTTSSKGGLDAMALLCKAYGQSMRAHPDEWPVIEIGSDSYAHPKKDLGRIKVPTFKIIAWTSKDVFLESLGEPAVTDMIDMEDVAAVEFPEPDPVPVPAPKAAKKANRI